MVLMNKAQRNREASFGFLLQVLSRRSDNRMKERLAAAGVDVKIFANLMVLAEEDGINQRELGKKLDFPEYYTSRNLDILVRAGYAERRPDPNSRRSILIYLTQEGRSKAAILPAIIKSSNDEELSDLTAIERKTVVSLLQKIAGIKPH